MESITSFISDHSLWGVLVAIVAVSIVVSILKSLVRMAMIVAVIGLVLVVFFNFKPEEVIDKGKQIADSGSQLLAMGSDDNLISTITSGDFWIKKENGETIIEIESLGIRYSLDQLFSQLQQDRENKIEELDQMVDQ
ncbi:hypothetical protein [Aquibacillus salsiterrae]|uniref:Uncharacterized protein n=1 Tax=Aquibacillus salsiterrae TaxID=2950439 RepID=A0A9X3WF11_9BACI|nr:hypothetical protein [Aquibacillus salsiterrae]MDC3417246.1 hypothetical protein [Aquibacillus salsiterrae]